MLKLSGPKDSPFFEQDVSASNSHCLAYKVKNISTTSFKSVVTMTKFFQGYAIYSFQCILAFQNNFLGLFQLTFFMLIT